MPKKSNAQLDREIDEALSKPRDLSSATGKQLAAAARRANDQIHDLVNNKYFKEIPLDELFQIVERAGFHLDPDEKACILTGRDGKATWDLYGAAGIATPGGEARHMLVLNWHRMDVTGRYEVVAYVS